MKHNQMKALTKAFCRGNRWNYALSMASTALFVAINLVIAWLMQQLIDVTTGGAQTLSILQLAILSAIIVGGLLLLCLTEVVFFPRFLQRAMRQYKEEAFAALLQKGMAAFSAENTSTYLSALSNDVNSIESNYLSQVFTLVTSLGTGLGALALMLYYSPLLTLIAVGLTLLPLVSSLLTGNLLPKAEQQVSKRNDSFLGVLKDSLCGFSVTALPAKPARTFPESREELQAT